MEIRLQAASLFDGKAVWEMLREIPPDESGFMNSGHGVEYHEFSDYLESRIKMANGVDLPEGWVPQHYYWLFDGGRPVGMSKLRTRLVEGLFEHGGNIGYGVRPSERKKGYGTKLLSLTLDKAKAKGLDMVLITCSSDNIGSRKIIEANGGKLHGCGSDNCRYWILL